MLDHLRALNAGAEPLGSFGAVIGATIGDEPELDFVVQRADPGARLRRPGWHRRRHPPDLRQRRRAVTPSSSRDLLRSGPSVDAMRDEALRLNDELRA